MAARRKIENKISSRSVEERTKQKKKCRKKCHWAKAIKRKKHNMVNVVYDDDDAGESDVSFILYTLNGQWIAIVRCDWTYSHFVRKISTFESNTEFCHGASEVAVYAEANDQVLSIANIYALSHIRRNRQKKNSIYETVIWFFSSICHFQWADFLFCLLCKYIHIDIHGTKECRIKMKRKWKMPYE